MCSGSHGCVCYDAVWGLTVTHSAWPHQLDTARRNVEEMEELHKADTQNLQAGVTILRNVHNICLALSSHITAQLTHHKLRVLALQMELERERVAREEAAVLNSLMDKLLRHCAALQDQSASERVSAVAGGWWWRYKHQAVPKTQRVREFVAEINE